MTDPLPPLGIIETMGLGALYAAMNAMFRHEDITLLSHRIHHSGLAMAIVTGPEESLKTALDEGAKWAERAGELVAAHVMLEPTPRLMAIIDEAHDVTEG